MESSKKLCLRHTCGLVPKFFQIDLLCDASAILVSLLSKRAYGCVGSARTDFVASSLPSVVGCSCPLYVVVVLPPLRFG